jgi:membrane protein DedA with SNARE-associated domain
MISAFVASYGYLAVFLGTLLEGETVLIAAGFAAHRGLLDWPLVALAATAGGTVGDLLAFLLGRWKGEVLFERFPALARRRPAIQDLMQRYDVACILAIRFIYGLRIAGPVVMGTSGISPLRFAVLNLMGAALWAVLISGAGYAFGLALGALIGNVRRIEEAVLLAILALGAASWAWRGIRARARRRATKT